MPQISVVLATFNEEKNLAKCLDTVQDLADEIVIVDGTSSDKTVEIAKKYGARVIVRENPKIFHINKQIAIDSATRDWVLQLDADEHLTPELKKEIKEVISSQKSAVRSQPVNGFWLPRKNYFLGRFLMKGGQYPDYTLRLYRKGMGKLPQKDVHEQAEVEGEVGYLSNALLHYPYKNFSEYFMKWRRYNSIFADQIRDERRNKRLIGKIIMLPDYLFIKPTYWFGKTYIRHKGFMDGFPGFIFSLFSSIRYPFSFLLSF